MRLGYVAPLLFGFLLIYIGAFGLSGFGIIATFNFASHVPSFPAVEQFTSISQWNSIGYPVPIIANVGVDSYSAYFDGTSQTEAMSFGIGTTITSTAAPWTMFFCVKVVKPPFEIEYDCNVFDVKFDINASGTGAILYAVGSLAHQMSSTFTLNQWHNVSMSVPTVTSVPQVTVGLDGANVGDSFLAKSSTDNPQIILTASLGGQTYVDWIEIDHGTLLIPQVLGGGKSSTPTTGSLLASCFRNGIYVSGATVSIAGQTGTTDSSGNVTISNISLGTYTAIASLSGFADVPMPVTIQEGKVTIQSFYFATKGVVISITTLISGGQGTISPSGVIDLGYAGASNAKTFTITASSGYYISSIVLINPSTTLSTPISFPSQATSTTVTLNDNDIQISETLSVTFASSTSLQYTLTVYSTYGNPSPAVGTHSYNSGATVSCSVSSPVTVNGVTYTCTGWTGTGSVSASSLGTSFSFYITEDSTISWNWKSGVNNTVNGPWTLTVVSQYGDPTPSVGSWQENDQTSITCTVGNGVITQGDITYTCIGWTGTGSVPSSSSGTSTTFVITQASTITWNWQSSTNLNNNQTNNNVPTLNFNINWSAIAQNIDALISANRGLLLTVGGLISLVSFVGLILPPKRLPISW